MGKVCCGLLVRRKVARDLSEMSPLPHLLVFAASVRGVAFDNISLEEFTFSQDASYSTTVIDLDAEENRTIAISNHDFVSGVYKIEVESIFDNTTQGTAWYGFEEISLANNLGRVIFLSLIHI